MPPWGWPRECIAGKLFHYVRILFVLLLYYIGLNVVAYLYELRPPSYTWANLEGSVKARYLLGRTIFLAFIQLRAVHSDKSKEQGWNYQSEWPGWGPEVTVEENLFKCHHISHMKILNPGYGTALARNLGMNLTSLTELNHISCCVCVPKPITANQAIS